MPSRATCALATAWALASPATASADEPSPAAPHIAVPSRDPAAVPTRGVADGHAVVECFVWLDRAPMEALRVVDEIERNYPGKLSILMYPVTHVSPRTRTRDRERAERLVHAAYEAFELGRFDDFVRALATGRRRRWEQIEQAETFAGIPVQQLRDAVGASAHRRRIARGQRRMEALGASRRRFLFVNGVEVRSGEDLTAILQAQIARSRVEVPDAPETARRRSSARPTPPQRGIDVLSSDQATPPANGSLIALPSDLDPARLGRRDAPVAIALFCSLKTSNCERMYSAARAVQRALPSLVRLEYHHLFYESVHRTARAKHAQAQCARRRGLFWQYATLSYRELTRSDRPSESEWTALGLGDKELAHCAASREISQAIARALAGARRAGIQYTPSTVVGERLYVGRLSARELHELVVLEVERGLLDDPPDAEQGLFRAMSQISEDKSSGL